MVSPILPTPCCLWIKEAMLSTMACCAYTEPCCSSEKILGKGNLEETSGNDCIFLAIFKYSIFCGEICHMTYPINHWINSFKTLWLCQSSTMWVSRAYPLNQDWIGLASRLLTVDIKKKVRILSMSFCWTNQKCSSYLAAFKKRRNSWEPKAQGQLFAEWRGFVVLDQFVTLMYEHIYMIEYIILYFQYPVSLHLTMWIL